MCSVLDEKCNLQCQCSKLKIQNIESWGMCHFAILRLNFPQFPGFPSWHCESMGLLCVFNNSLLESCNSCDQSPDKYLSVETNGKRCGSRCSIFSFVSYRKNLFQLFKSCLLKLIETWPIFLWWIICLSLTFILKNLHSLCNAPLLSYFVRIDIKYIGIK